MIDGLDRQDQARDRHGRWMRGQSGNWSGRSKGSRNRWRRADPARAMLWKGSEWRLHFTRTMAAAQGDQAERAGAAYAGANAYGGRTIRRRPSLACVLNADSR
jgi:hypothetical protein